MKEKVIDMDRLDENLPAEISPRFQKEGNKIYLDGYREWIKNQLGIEIQYYDSGNIARVMVGGKKMPNAEYTRRYAEMGNRAWIDLNQNCKVFIQGCFGSRLKTEYLDMLDGVAKSAIRKALEA